jgi:hypothetical protein
MIDPFTAYAAYSTGKKWLPYAIGGGLGLALGCLIAWAAWSWQGREISGLEGQLKGATDSRDIFEASAKAQAQGARDALRVNEGQKKQIEFLTTAWRNTRADAEKIAAQARSRASAYAEAERTTMENAHVPQADPADIALRNLECLRRLREAGAAATAATCRD